MTTYYAYVRFPSGHACVFVPVCEVEPTHLVCWECVADEDNPAYAGGQRG